MVSILHHLQNLFCKPSLVKLPNLEGNSIKNLKVELTIQIYIINPLPDGQNAKISQFADDTTLILEDTISLRKAMNIVNSFGALSGLQLNKKKTKAMWIGSSSKNI